MSKIIVALLLLAIGAVTGFVLAALFTGADSIYDNDDIMRAYSAGFDAGRKAGGWPGNGEADEA